MTKAMKRKFENAVEENETEFKIFRISRTDICDTRIETITKQASI